MGPREGHPKKFLRMFGTKRLANRIHKQVSLSAPTISQQTAAPKPFINGDNCGLQTHQDQLQNQGNFRNWPANHLVLPQTCLTFFLLIPVKISRDRTGEMKQSNWLLMQDACTYKDGAEMLRKYQKSTYTVCKVTFMQNPSPVQQKMECVLIPYDQAKPPTPICLLAPHRTNRRRSKLLELPLVQGSLHNSGWRDWNAKLTSYILLFAFLSK